ncbi:hypothetical protein [Clostridium chrysemydis]|uniref:hypothetical protein n=1 Tax=Clostridium chrysemydis TaxID=2665504 RepID=UPI0018840C76|nr:hypothetical protein [Clostridium chrysemydis]
MKYKIISKETFDSNYIFEAERFGDKVIKIYSKMSTDMNLNCELFFDEGIPNFVVESFIELFKKISIEFIDKNVMYFDKNFNVTREIKLLSTKVNDEYYLLNEIADIKICRTKESELEELKLFK